MTDPGTSANVFRWEELKNGQDASFQFTVSDDDMLSFAGFSGDSSRIHVNHDYAVRNGFDAPVVYGALIVSKLSYFVGMLIPGDFGLATDWQVNFHQPLYVGELAKFTGEIAHLSAATRNVRIKFVVESAGRLVTSGTAGSTLLTP